jgi:tRNA dimethylallyltransferase
VTATGRPAPAVVAVFGPTASGKSAVAEALAERLGTEVVSADAMQVYDGLPILTNQPTTPTRLVGFWPLDREMSVGEYQTLAHAAIDEIVAAGCPAVVAGGTGLYLRSAVSDMRLPPPPAEGARARWEAVYDAGPGEAFAVLQARDARAAAAIHVNDRRRVVRALELAEVHASLVPPVDRLWASDTRLPTLIVGLDIPKEDLAARIVERTRRMFASGVVAEVEAAIAQGVSQTAAKALGLAEIVSLPPGEAERRLVVRTGRYAAYQRKWMRRVPGLASVDATRPPDEVADAILEMARARQQLSPDRAR